MDDDAGTLRWLERILAAEGHFVTTAPNGLEGLAQLNENPFAFEVVITDLRMPRFDGFDLIEHGRVAGYSGAWIIYAAMMSPNDHQRLRGLGVDRIIPKTAAIADLLGVLKEVQACF